MNLYERQQVLEQELEEIRQQISLCKHDYDPPKYDPEIRTVGRDYRFERVGAHWFVAPTSYGTEEKPRWSQTCRICGYRRYTYQTVKKSVVISEEPVF